MFPISINIFYLSFNWIWTTFFDMNMLETRDTSIDLGTTNLNIGDYNSIKSRAIEKIKKSLFHVALAIFYIMPSAGLLRLRWCGWFWRWRSLCESFLLVWEAIQTKIDLKRILWPLWSRLSGFHTLAVYAASR